MARRNMNAANQIGRIDVTALLEKMNRRYRVEGFGEVGYAGLHAFVPFDGQRQVADLKVHEATEGKFQNPGSDGKPERIWRTA